MIMLIIFASNVYDNLMKHGIMLPYSPCYAIQEELGMSRIPDYIPQSTLLGYLSENNSIFT
jgi:hypothetical protein